MRKKTKTILYFSEKALFSMELAEPVVQNTPALYYFQEFCIQPMRLNLSFSRTDRINAVDEEYAESFFLFF